MNNLRDKLLKAGLVTEEAAKKAEATSQAPRPPAPRRPDARPGPTREAAPRRAEPPVPRFAPLAGSPAASREQARKQLELDRFLREKVLAAEVPLEVGATVFYFTTRKGKLRRLTLTDAQAKLLQEGKLAIVERPDPGQIEHALVPPEVAVELLPYSDKVVRFLNKEGQRVGFLTDEEISQRAHEAHAPTEPSQAGRSGTAGAAEAAPEAAVGPNSELPALAPVQRAARAEPETWITVRRTKS